MRDLNNTCLGDLHKELAIDLMFYPEHSTIAARYSHEELKQAITFILTACDVSSVNDLRLKYMSQVASRVNN